MAVKGSKLGSTREVVRVQIVNSERGTIKVLDESSSKAAIITDRQCQNLNPDKEHIAIIVTQNANTMVQSITEYDPDGTYTVIVQHFNTERSSDAVGAIQALIDSGLVTKLSIKDEALLFDEFTKFSVEAETEVPGIIILKGHDQITAWKAQVNLGGNKFQAKVFEDDNPQIEKMMDATKFLVGAVVEKSVSAATTTSQWIGDFYVPKEIRPLVSLMEAVVQRDGITNILVLGQSGTGKTEFFMNVAKHLGLELVIVDCSMQPNANAWFYHNSLVDGRTEITLTTLSEAMERGNVLVLLDEVNRVDNAAASNSLLPVLDNRRKVTLKGTKEVRVGKRTIFAGTMNHGHQYVGTDTMDAALLNRWRVTAKMPNLSIVDEKKIIMKEFPAVPEKLIDHVLKVFQLFRERLTQEGVSSIDATTRKVKAVVEIIQDMYDPATDKLMIPMKDCFALGFINQILDNPEAVRFLIEIANTPLK